VKKEWSTITVVASLENERFKGGIYTIAHGLLNRKDLFETQGYGIRGVSSCQTEARDIENIGKFKMENIANVFSVLKAIYSNEKITSSTLFYGITSTGLGFFKDVFIFSLLKLRWPKKLTILNVQFTGIDSILPNNLILNKLSIFLLDKFIDALVVPNFETKDDFIGVGYCRSIRVLNNFFIEESTDNVSMVRKEDACVRLLYLGMIDERKGFDRALRLLNELKQSNIELHVCGEYLSKDFKEEIETYIEDNGLDNHIFFHGFVSGRQKKEIVSSCDVLVLLTSGEGMAMALLEGLHSGLSVLTTNITSTKEVFDNVKFELYDIENKEGMLIKLKEYLSDQEKLKLDKKVCSEVVKHFTIESHIKSLCEILADVNTQT